MNFREIVEQENQNRDIPEKVYPEAAILTLIEVAKVNRLQTKVIPVPTIL
jgi:hypothetical protein